MFPKCNNKKSANLKCKDGCLSVKSLSEFLPDKDKLMISYYLKLNDFINLLNHFTVNLIF